MNISLKICALCQKPLAIRYPGKYGGSTYYVCQTHIPETKLSHYYIEKSPIGAYTQVIHVPPYVILNVSGKETSDIYPFSLEEGKISDREKVISLPRLPITTAERLSQRIKILVLFS